MPRCQAGFRGRGLNFLCPHLHAKCYPHQARWAWCAAFGIAATPLSHPLLAFLIGASLAALATVPPFVWGGIDMPMSPPVLGSVGAAEKRRRFDAERRQAKASRRWYGSTAWRAISAQQLAEHPFCIMCYERDGAMVPAKVCDHVEPHREDYGKFWHGKRQSLCAPCHSSIKQREEQHLTR